MPKLKLGFHYHTPAIQSGDEIRMPGYLGLFIDSVAIQCAEVVCFLHSPSEHELQQMDYSLQSNNVRLVGLGPRTSVPIRTAKAFVRRQVFRRWQPHLDIMLIRASTPLLPVIDSVWLKPMALLLVSDATAGLENLPQPRWRKALIMAWAKWYQSRQDRVAERSLTFVNSRLLYEQFQSRVPNLVETRTTTLSAHDFFERSDTCSATPYRLLYAGRMTRIKGLFEIVEALAILVDEGFDLVLDLVGMVDNGDLVLDQLYVLAEQRGVRNRIQYHGYKTAGSELLAYYRHADIYVIASQASSEGFPRTIWEAMASSVPVVATKVGSIPAYAGNAALLVPPKESDKLTNAVRRLLTEKELRQDLIKHGMVLAKNNTLEERAQDMMTGIETWLQGKTPVGKAMHLAIERRRHDVL